MREGERVRVRLPLSLMRLPPKLETNRCAHMIIFFSCPRTISLRTLRYYTSATDTDSPLNLLHLLQLSVRHHSLQVIKQSHARILSLGFAGNAYLATTLISAYAISTTPTESRLVFDSVQQQNVYSWNSLINGYVKNQAYNEAFGLFKEMCCGSVLPDDFTLATILKACGEVGDLIAGKLVHGKVIKLGFASDTVVANALMSMYNKYGKFVETRILFDKMPHRNVGSWNVLISGYANSGNGGSDKDLWDVVMLMQIDGVQPDGFTLSTLLPVCGADTGKCDYGRELHCFAVKNKPDVATGSDVHLGCCLIDMYSKSNRVVVGRRVFDRMERKNIYTWTAMISGYVQSGILDETLVLFREMQVRDGMKPNKVSLLSVLPACGSLAGLTGGKQIHGFAIRKEFIHDAPLCNALIDMYAKCGSLQSARRIFEDDSFCKDTISWSTMISGYGLHGKGEEAIILYDQMLKLGNKPDMITTVGVLSACGRSGLVNEGLNIYNLVTDKYGIEPTTEICACIVDILGRSGQLDQALEFIKKMPVEPGPSIWGALVSASVIHGNHEMQDLAYSFLIQVEPENPSNYVSLSNLHASSRRWDAVAEVRTMMKEKGLKKAPGCSWISINGMTHCFCVADMSHPHSNSIYEMLDDLVLMMKGAPYSHDFNNLM